MKETGRACRMRHRVWRKRNELELQLIQGGLNNDGKSQDELIHLHENKQNH